MSVFRSTPNKGKTHPSVMFGSYSNNIASSARSNDKLLALVPQIVDVLWTNQRVADAFFANQKGWQKDIADELSISTAQINRAVAAYGKDEFKELVSNNPAGHAPEVRRPEASLMPSMTYYGCENQTYGCDTPSSRCGTNSTCGTCACGTAGCATASCQSSSCGTYMCINMKKRGPQGPV